MVAQPFEIYQIKITLRDSQPPIWRRIHVQSGITLAKLHKILQRVMGWEDVHLHQFLIHGDRYGSRDCNTSALERANDERRCTLGKVAKAGSEFVYHYDFGDNWEHVLVIETALPPQEGGRYPVCLAGARACPPEDVGGIPGYENYLRAINDPKHPESAEYLEWIGRHFDSEAFNVDEINSALHAMR